MFVSRLPRGQLLLPLAFLFAIFLTFSSCDTLGIGGGDDNQAPDAQLSASTTDVVAGDTVQLDASGSSDPDSDELSFNWSLESPSNSNTSLSSQTGVKTSFVADVSGDFTVSVDVSDGDVSDSDEATITAKEKLPEEVTVSFENRAAGGDSLIAGDLTLAGESIPEAAGKKSGSFTAASSREPKQLCFTENEFFEQSCEEIALTNDVSVTLFADRKQVTINVGLLGPDGSVSSDAVGWIFEPFRSDSVKFEGELSLTLPKRSGERIIFGDLIIEDSDTEKLDRYQKTVTIAANAGVDREIQLDLIPACGDNLDNDDDGEVDIWEDTNGNNIPERGEGDPGCTGPEDDNEGHITWVRSIGSGGEGTDKSRFISSKESNREIFWGDNLATDFPKSIADAVAVDARVEVKVEADQLGEGFAMEMACGPDEKKDNINLTEIAEDQGRDGWVFAFLRGITAEFFATGTDCARSYLHASKVRGEEPGDGDDDVFFLVAGDDTIRVFQIRWTIEEEDNHKAGMSAKVAKRGKACFDTPGGKMCATDKIGAW